MMHRIFFSLCLLLAISNEAIAKPKECSEKISPDLLKLLNEKFPEYRIPKLKDLDEKSIGFDVQNGGTGCYVATNGDFDGDRHEDVALLLTSARADASLVVALRKGKSWKTYLLPTFCESIKFCYVEPEPAGTYIRSSVIEEPITRKNERSQITSKHMSIRTGTLESTGIVFVYSKGEWNYVWVSD